VWGEAPRGACHVNCVVVHIDWIVNCVVVRDDWVVNCVVLPCELMPFPLRVAWMDEVHLAVVSSERVPGLDCGPSTDQG